MSTLTFDSEQFGKYMLGRSDVSFKHKDNNGWNARPDDGKNMAMEYSSGGYDYRTWRQQVSVCRKSAAILVSCKIDQRRNFPRKDDHLVILASVNRAGAVITVQAAAQSLHHNVSGETAVIVNDPKQDTSVRLKDAVHQAIKDMLGKKSDDGYYHMGEVAATNLQCLAASVVLR